MGMNRHTPRAVVYGPRNQGGRQLLDLEVEQLVLNFQTLIGHLCRGGKMGVALTAALRDIQIETGLQKTFYEYNPNCISYITENTRWRYFWITCYKYNIKPIIYNMWILTTDYKDNKNIMEYAIQDRMYLRKDKYRLVSINRCRLYLNCFYVSKLMDNDGYVHKKYLTGEMTREHHVIKLPALQKPTPLEFSEWKDFIFCNFLAGPFKVHPPIQEKYTVQDYNPYINKVTQMQNAYMDSTMVQQAMEKLPQHMQEILGKVDLTHGKGECLARVIKNGDLIEANDGLVVELAANKRGGHAFILQHKSNNTIKIQGMGPTLQSDSLSSITTEHFRILGALVTIYMITTMYNIQTNNTVTIVSDSKETVK